MTSNTLLVLGILLAIFIQSVSCLENNEGGDDTPVLLRGKNDRLSSPRRHHHHRYSHIAKQINDVFEHDQSNTDNSNANTVPVEHHGRRQLLRMSQQKKSAPYTTLEPLFDNAQDIQDILLDVNSGKTHDEAEGDFVKKDHDDNLYSTIPDNVTQVEHSYLQKAQQCKCIDCIQDTECGNIWKRETFPNNQLSITDTTNLKIHIVISHCMAPLDWLHDFTSGYHANIKSIHVITKCGKIDQATITAPKIATIEEYENLGRCDHTYAYYITSVLPHRIQPGKERDSIAIFLKDDISAANFHQSGHWNTFHGLVQGARSTHGFGCGIIPGRVDFGRDSFDLSTYHETYTLHAFSMDTYYRNKGGKYTVNADEFLSEYKSLHAWWVAMGAPVPAAETVQVCYGGVFAGSVHSIYKSDDITKVIQTMDTSVWKNIERSLSRGNNIQEGHYAERSWGPLISTPLSEFSLEALVKKSDGVYLNKSSFHGALLRRPKLFLRVGVEGTDSTELLRESLVDKMALFLEMDGYKVAEQGKHLEKNGMPDIDDLGACMWSDIYKSQLAQSRPEEALTCHEHSLSDLSSYMKHAFQESQDLILGHPALSRQGTADPLSIYLSPVFDVKVVLYYRRFFEWVSITYLSWRAESMRRMIQHSLNPGNISSPDRYIDFLREHCKQLFYGKNVNEDGVPVRKLHRHPRQLTKNSSAMSTFDPTTNFDLEDLTGFEGYVYFVAKQYHAQQRFRRGIKIVNYHDTHSVETNFYCHVLHDAPNSCNDAAQRDRSARKVAQDEELFQTDSTVPAIIPSVAIEDIMIEAFLIGRLSFDASQPRKSFEIQLSLWTKMIAVALQSNGIGIEHLPRECLYNYERLRLLEASLAYEEDLLPEFFASHRGEHDLKKEFEKQNFCSVDTDAVLADPGWDFLFEDSSNYAVQKQQKAVIHVGAGVSSLDQAIDADKVILAEDGYFLFGSNEHLAPCMWSEAQRKTFASSNDKDRDASCKEHLLPLLGNFLSNAAASDKDVIISDEWLDQPASETGLLETLPSNFDPFIVITHRRFFEWIIDSYHQLRDSSGASAIDLGRNHVRLIDYIRLICHGLFASEIEGSGQRLVDLVDAPGYTYQVHQQYFNIAEYQSNIKIVNYHDDNVAKSFYCNILGAERACKMESDKPKQMTHQLSKIRMPKESYTYEVGDNYQDRLEDDLPKECLSQAEKSMVLAVSLEYEKILLPDHYSSGGEEETRRHFDMLLANDAFCSVDLERIKGMHGDMVNSF